MKRNNLATIILISLLLLSCGEIEEDTTNSTSTEPSSRSEDSTNLSTENTPVRSGSFVTTAKTTTGQASIVSENEQYYLELDEEFSTGNGPDVKVILHRNKVVPANVNEENYINLAPLQSFSGKQRYLIPANVDLDEFNSVGIWCKKFNVTFGYASL